MRSAARQALRRQALGRFVQHLGLALVIAGAAATLGVGVDRLFALELPAWLLVAAPVGLGALYALVRSALAPRNLLVAAAHVDRALTLHDQLGSAIALEQDADNDPFALLAVADAQRTAQEAPIKEATPIEFGASWWIWPITLTLAIASAIFLPSFDLAHRQQNQTKEATQIAQRQEATDDIAQAREAVAPEKLSTVDLATPTDMQTLDDLQQQLERGEIDPDEARAQAASVLNDAADRTDQQADEQERQLESLQTKLASSSNVGDTSDSPRADEPSELSESLASGDYDRVRRLLEESQKQLESLSETEREQMANELEQVADSIDPAADQPPAADHSKTEESLKSLGVSDETIEKLSDETDADAIRQSLEDQGVDEPRASDLADQLAQERREETTEEQAEQDAADLKEALQDAADEVRPPSSAPEPESDQPVEPKPKDEQPDKPDTNPASEPNTAPDAPQQNTPTGERQPDASSQSRDDTSNEKPGAENNPSTPSSENQSPTSPPDAAPAPSTPPSSPASTPDDSSSHPQTQPSQRSAPTPDDKPASAPQPSQNKTPSTPDTPPTDQKTPTQSPSTSPQPPQTPSSQPSSDSPAFTEHTPQPNQTPAPGASDSKKPGDATSPNPFSKKGLDRARQLLKKFQERKDRAKEQRQISKEARKKAKELIDSMSPEQRKELERWAKQLAREHSAQPPESPAPSIDPADTKLAPMDLRPKESAPDRVIAQWFDPNAKPDQTGAVSHRAIDEKLRQAAQGAERAVEQQSVHRRYNDIIKRYFDAANRRGEKPATPAKPVKSPSPKKKDAGSSPGE